MKLCFDKEFIGSYGGMLRLLSLGLGGGVFGTISNNNMYDRATSHALMWVSVFAWIVGIILFVAKLIKRPLTTECGEQGTHLVFAFLYLLTTILFGVYDLVDSSSSNNMAYGGLGVLVFLFAAINFLVYLDLFIIPIVSDRKNKPKKEPKDAEEGKADEAKDDNQNKEENNTKPEEASSEPEAQQEATE